MNTDKLPKWAQEHIKDLKRERDVAIRELKGYLDYQTPSPFFVSDYFCTGEENQFVKRYIQTHRMCIDHAGVFLDILLRDDTIELKWDAGQYNIRDVAMIPQSYQSIRLVARENMYPKNK